ncbi:Crp/Fnr family transcriptional regulator [soil metagenome]
MQRAVRGNPWTRKLEQVGDLEDVDRRLLDRLIHEPKLFRAGEDIISVGEVPDLVNVVIEGWVCRYKVLGDGQRQIMALLVPGDICDLTVFVLKEMDHSIGALTDAVVARIPRNEIMSILETRPKLTLKLWWSSLQDEAVMREWIVGLGRRTAYERTAHLFYELHSRLRGVGLCDDEGGMALPLRQTDLSDILGLSYVHMNRVLQRMREEGLITLTRRELRFPSPARLKAVAGFEDRYLHLPKVKHKVSADA